MAAPISLHNKSADDEDEEQQTFFEKLTGWRLAAFAASLGMFFFGFAEAVLNAPQPIIEKFLKKSFMDRYGMTLDDAQVTSYLGATNTVLLLGGTISSPFGAMIVDNYGRKTGLLLTQIPALLGTLSIALVKSLSSYELLMIGRFLVGVACGLFSTIAPVYILEISPAKLRGSTGAFNTFAYTLGLFVASVSGLPFVLGTENFWPVLVLLNAVPCFLQLTILPFMPESPEYLLNQTKDWKLAFGAARKLHGKVGPKKLMERASGPTVKLDKSAISVFALLKTSKYWLPLTLAIIMHAAMVMSGFNGMIYYSTVFFQRSGIDCSISQYATILISVVLGASLVVSGPLIYKFGGRTVELWGMSVCIVLMVGITIALHVVEIGVGDLDCSEVASSAMTNAKQVDPIGIFLIVCTLMFVMMFAIGPYNVPWTMSLELFDEKSRGAAASVTLFGHWAAFLIYGIFFPPLLAYNRKLSFLPSVLIVTFSFFFLVFYLPETKGRSQEMINRLFGLDKVWSKPIGLQSNHLLEQQTFGKGGSSNVFTTYENAAYRRESGPFTKNGKNEKVYIDLHETPSGAVPYI